MSGGSWSKIWTLDTACHGLAARLLSSSTVELFFSTSANVIYRAVDAGDGTAPTASSFATGPTNSAFRGLAFQTRA